MGHFIGDYYLQWNQLIQLKKTSFMYLILHVLIYVLPFMGSVILFGYDLREWGSFLLVIFISHMLIDMGKKYLDKLLSEEVYFYEFLYRSTITYCCFMDVSFVFCG